MISWITIIILAYFFFSLSSLGDKLVLNYSKSPKLYVFWVGFLSLLVLLLIPFVGINLPSTESFLWIILTSLVFILGLYVLYSAVLRFEVSRVIPIVGALQPIFILILSWIFFKEVIIKSNLLAFFILLIASFIISFESKIKLNTKLIISSLLASLLVAFGFIFTKKVFLIQPFFQGIIWIGVFNFLFAILFLIDSNLREQIFVKKSAFRKKNIVLVAITQSAGGIAGFLQNIAIYLAPASSLAIINVLRGIQYIFLFVITLIFSIFLPKIIKEDISIGVILQKLLSIILIGIGLSLLVLK